MLSVSGGPRYHARRISLKEMDEDGHHESLDRQQLGDDTIVQVSDSDDDYEVYDPMANNGPEMEEDLLKILQSGERCY